MIFRDFFIPSLRNNLQPYLLRRPVLSLVAVLILIVEIGVLVYVTLAFTVPHSPLPASVSNALAPAVKELVPEAITRMTNSYRAERGLKPLAPNVSLQAAAQARAEDMAARGYFSHQDPSGEVAWWWLSRAGYRYRYAGENLAVNFSDAAEALESWSNSPSHEANLVNKNYSETGVGIARGRYQNRSTTFIVQFFASPVLAQAKPGSPISSQAGALAFLTAAPRTFTFYLISFLVLAIFVLFGILLVTVFLAHRAESWGKRLWEPFLLFRSQLVVIILLGLLAVALLGYNANL